MGVMVQEIVANKVGWNISQEARAFFGYEAALSWGTCPGAVGGPLPGPCALSQQGPA